MIDLGLFAKVGGRVGRKNGENSCFENSTRRPSLALFLSDSASIFGQNCQKFHPISLGYLPVGFAMPSAKFEFFKIWSSQFTPCC